MAVTEPPACPEGGYRSAAVRAVTPAPDPAVSRLLAEITEAIGKHDWDTATSLLAELREVDSYEAARTLRMLAAAMAEAAGTGEGKISSEEGNGDG